MVRPQPNVWERTEWKRRRRERNACNERMNEFDRSHRKEPENGEGGHQDVSDSSVRKGRCTRRKRRKKENTTFR
jgi:hypothetical protein